LVRSCPFDDSSIPADDRRLVGYLLGQPRSNTMTMPNTESQASPADQTGQQGGGTAREQIRGMKDQVVDQAKSTFQQARDRASSSLGESKGQFADQFGNLADALRRTTEHLRSEDQQRIAGLTETVARQIEQVADYVRNKDARAMRQDLENLARRQPALMIGGALVLGLIGARFLKSSERKGGGRFADGQRYGRERSFGYTGYNQPFNRDAEIERNLPSRTGYGTESGMGGGYAGA
jgi:ribosomal protein S15P/S13E